MHRRSLLRGALGSGLTLAAPAVGTANRDGARQDEPYEPLGRVDVDGAAEAVVGDDGETVYLAATDGFATVDVSDPAEPSVLAERRYLEVEEGGPPLLEILDVKVEGDRLVVPGPANQGDPTGFFLYDVSDPADPERVGEFYRTDFPIHNCYLEGEYLYLTGNGTAVDGGAADEDGAADGADGDGGDANDEGGADGMDVALVIVDVSGDDPEEVARWSLDAVDERWREVASGLRVLHDVYVRDEVAYLAHWDAGTYLLDVSDPTDPEYVAHVSEHDVEDLLEVDSEYGVSREATGPPGNDHHVRPGEDGSILAVGRESWTPSSAEEEGPSGIDLYDVSDPDDPERLSRIDPPPADDSTRRGTWTTSHNFELRDGRLYSSWYQGGLKIHDVSDPADPEELAWWRRPDEAALWTARVVGDGEAVIASSYSVHTHVGNGLYAFPDRAGTQPDPPALVDDPRGNGTADATGNGTDETTESGSTGNEPANGTGNETTGAADDGDDPVPGFAVPGAVAGLGALAFGALARDRDRSDGGDEAE